ncbi:MAG: T9SS type A sorting domain-containing protein [Bacteroidota bacterium]
MKITLYKNHIYTYCIFIFLFIFSPQYSIAQPSLNLTISGLLSWQPSSVTPQNISSVPLSPRVISPNFQVGSLLDTNAKILYCPDGMNNFGSYIDSAAKFNLFNFSHWQYIDILAWFGGSASTPIVIPAKSWVDAAHRNGVKVIGTIFMAPAAYGGTQPAMQSFLVQDSLGNFTAAKKMIEIANYYHFDGWMLNFETSVNSATGALASSFVKKLDSAYTGEVIWYDAMLQNGSVSYQNCLNSNDAYFFQNSTGLFTNYAWSFTSTVTGSNTYATGLGLSPFKVYTGADMWPSRTAQPAFNSYSWIDKIITNGVAKTSIALFATNFTFNYASYSTFNTDSSAYNNFYSVERKIFSGVDQNPFVVDSTWKGIGNYIPVRTTLTSLPFQTDFNTGHGFNYYDQGNVLVAGSWSNISHQSPLPSWTFYAAGVSINYDFNTAFSGGSSLSIASTVAGNYSIPLYSVDLITTSDLLNLELALKSSSDSIDSVSIYLTKKNSALPAVAVFHPAFNGNWEDLSFNSCPVDVSDTLISIVLNIHSSGAFNLNIGKIGIETASGTIVQNMPLKTNNLSVYPNPSDGNVTFCNNKEVDGQLNVFDLKGNNIIKKSIRKGETQHLILPHNNVYLYEFNNGKENQYGKLIVY